jgi:CRP/FNR family transcriptional regulator, cyclic AMP receptor protein
MTNINQLKLVSILSELNSEQLYEIEKVTIFQNFQSHKQILNKSETTTDVFFILSGKVVINIFSESGFEVIYLELKAGDCFGEFSAIDGAPRAANVTALTAVSVARLRAVDFRSFIQRFPSLGLSLSEYLIKLARGLSERIFELSTLPVRSRLRMELLRLARIFHANQNIANLNITGQDHVTLCPAPTHQEIAARISTHREAVSRELAHLKAQNLVVIGRKSIEIKSIKALRQSIDF